MILMICGFETASLSISARLKRQSKRPNAMHGRRSGRFSEVSLLVSDVRLGQKATSADDQTKSALPLRTDIGAAGYDVRFVP